MIFDCIAWALRHSSRENSEAVDTVSFSSSAGDTDFDSTFPYGVTGRSEMGTTGGTNSVS